MNIVVILLVAVIGVALVRAWQKSPSSIGAILVAAIGMALFDGIALGLPLGIIAVHPPNLWAGAALGATTGAVIGAIGEGDYWADRRRGRAREPV
jgi:hypothetical protein